MATPSKDPLVEHTDRLEQALAAFSEDSQQAGQQLRDALAAVKGALQQHPAPTEQNALAPAGPPQREISPGLTRQVGALRKDHRAMLQEVDGLLARLGSSSISPQDVADLVKSLRDFTAAENKMILETVMGEPGAGD